MSADVLRDEIARVARQVVRAEMRRPAYVSQRDVEGVVGGLQRRDFLRLSRAGAWPTHKEGRRILARTVDVCAWVEQRIAMSEAIPGNDHDPEAIAFARSGARRVSR